MVIAIGYLGGECDPRGREALPGFDVRDKSGKEKQICF